MSGSQKQKRAEPSRCAVTTGSAFSLMTGRGFKQQRKRLRNASPLLIGNRMHIVEFTKTRIEIVEYNIPCFVEPTANTSRIQRADIELGNKLSHTLMRRKPGELSPRCETRLDIARPRGAKIGSDALQ